MSGLNILPSYTDYFNLNTATTGLMTAAAWMGDVLACFIMQPITDRYGRKAGILASAIVCFIGIILQAAAQNTAMFVCSRIIVGLGSQLSSSAAPALLGELLPAVTRGRILGIFFSCYYVGSLLVSIINYGSQNIDSTWSWRLPSLLQLIPSVLALSLLPFVPESPRWLIASGKLEHAREVLIITKGDSNPNDPRVVAEFDTIEVTIAKEKEMFPRNPWIEIVSTPGNRKRLAILVSFGIMLEMFGNFVVS
jgi:MFS family permease